MEEKKSGKPARKKTDRTAYHKAWYRANKERLNAMARARLSAARAADPEKFRAQDRKYKAKAYNADPLKYRAQRLKYMYGITQEEYESMLISQKNLCAICRGKCKRGNLGVDHCHDTGLVRGLLCENCNRALGLMKDNPDLLRIAAEYLELSMSRKAV